MAAKFNLTAQLQLQSPTNVKQVVSSIQKQLKPVGVQVKLTNTKNLAQANRDLQNFGKSAKTSTKQMSEFNRTLQESARRFGVITLATGTLLGFVNSLKKSVKEAIAFERELIKVSQVTGKTVSQLTGLTDEVTRLATGFGAVSSDVLGVSRILAQAGFSAEETSGALDILAKTSLGPTFDDIVGTTEGAIAILRQFSDEAVASGGKIAFLEQSLDAVNEVSKNFAVESDDIIAAIRRTGGVFAAAGGEVNELIALFTSVRATTRESAETIATGLRTIFTRIQRTETVDQLRELGIELRDAEGNFVGAFEAIRRISEGLSAIDPRSAVFSEVAESLGGFRQVGKVIPLIQQFATAQDALRVAQEASGSVTKDAELAQQSLGVQIQKTREQFAALIRRFVDSEAFRSLATGGIKLAEAFIKITDSLTPLLPLLISLAGLKLGRAIAPAIASFAGIGQKLSGTGPISRFAAGGLVPGVGNRDTVPAMLTPGEFVIRKASVESIGAGNLASMNRYAHGGKVKKGKEPEKREIPIGGGIDFTHLDKRIVPKSISSIRDTYGIAPGQKISSVYTNLGLDLPGNWNKNWNQQKDYHGVTKDQFIKYVGRYRVFNSLIEQSKDAYKFRGEGAKEAQQAIEKGRSKLKKFFLQDLLSIKDSVFFDTDPDVIKSGVGDKLNKAAAKTDKRIVPFLNQITAIKTSDLEGKNVSNRKAVSSGIFGEDLARQISSTPAKQRRKFAAGGGVVQFPSSKRYVSYDKETYFKPRSQEFQTRPSGGKSATRFNERDSFYYQRKDKRVDLGKIPGVENAKSYKTYLKFAKSLNDRKRGQAFENVLEETGKITERAESTSRIDARIGKQLVEIKSTREKVSEANISDKMIGAAIDPRSNIDKSVEGVKQKALTDKANKINLGSITVLQDVTPTKLGKKQQETLREKGFVIGKKGFALGQELALGGIVLAANGLRVTGKTRKTEGLTLEEAVSSGLKRSQLTSGFGKEAVDSFFGGTAAEQQEQRRKAESQKRLEETTIDTKSTYGAVFLEKVADAKSGTRTLDVGKSKKLRYELKTAFLGADDANRIKNDIVAKDTLEAINKTSSVLASGIGETITPSKNIPNLQAIAGSIFEAGLARVSKERLALDADDTKIFDFPGGLKNASKVFGPDAAALANIKTDAKVASTGSAMDSIRDKVRNDLKLRKKFARGGYVQRFAQGGMVEDEFKPKLTVRSRAGFGDVGRKKQYLAQKIDFLTDKAKEGSITKVQEKELQDLIVRVKSIQKSRTERFAKRLAFQDGGKVKRTIGYIDSDVLADTKNEAVVRPEMERLGITSVPAYKDYLTKEAIRHRKSGGISKLRTIVALPGAGKSAIIQGGQKPKVDKATLRQTKRVPILKPQDFTKVDQVLDTSASVTDEKIKNFQQSDKVFVLSTSTKEEQEEIKRRRETRDTTGVNLFGRKPGTTTSAPRDSGPIEAQLTAELPEDKLSVLGIRQDAPLKRKKGEELVDVEKKKIGLFYGSLSPTTAGHESVLDAATSHGIKPKDFMVLVGSNESIRGSDPHNLRTAIFDQDIRTTIAKTAFEEKGVSVAKKTSRDFSVPKVFETTKDEAEQRKFVVAQEGSKAFVGDEGKQLAKYEKAGFKPVEVPRDPKGISGTKAREAILSGNKAAMQKLLSPSVYKVVESNLPNIQRRAEILPRIVEHVKKKQVPKLEEIEAALKGLPKRVDRKRAATDSEYAAQAEQVDELRKSRDKIKSLSGTRPFSIIRKLAKRYPEKYGFQTLAGGGKVTARDLKLGDVLDTGERVKAKIKVGGFKEKKRFVLMLEKDGKFERREVGGDETFKVKPSQKMAAGGQVDSVPALLTPGEFVVNKSAAQSIGYSNLHKMNKTGVQAFAQGGFVQRFARGGPTGERLGLPTVSGSLFGGSVADFNAVRDAFLKIGVSGEKLSSAMYDVNDALKKGLSPAQAFDKAFDSMIVGINDAKKAAEDKAKADAKASQNLGNQVVGAAQRFGGQDVSDAGFVGAAREDEGIRQELERVQKEEINTIARKIKAENDSITSMQARRIAEGVVVQRYGALAKEIKPIQVKTFNDVLKEATGKLKDLPNAIREKIGSETTRQTAESVQRIASSAQQFVFLGSSVAAVTAQFSILSDTTKTAVNRTAAELAGLVGIIGTVTDVFSSMLLAMNASVVARQDEKTEIKAVANNKKVESIASLDSATANAQEAISTKGAQSADDKEAISSKNVASANNALAQSAQKASTQLKTVGGGGGTSVIATGGGTKFTKSGGRLAGLINGVSAGLTKFVGVIAGLVSVVSIIALAFGAIYGTLRFFQNKFQATAEEFARAASKLREEFEKTGTGAEALANNLRLQSEAEFTSEQFEVSWKNLGRLVGSAIPQISYLTGSFGEIGAEMAKEAAVRQGVTNSLLEQLRAQQENIVAVRDFKQALTDIDLLKGLTPTERVERRVETAGEIELSSATDVRSDFFELGKIINNLGRQNSDVLRLSQEELVEAIKSPEKRQELDITPLQAGQLQTALDNLANNLDNASLRVRESFATLGEARRIADPSKTFKELVSEGGPYADSLGQAREALESESVVREQNLRLQSVEAARLAKQATDPTEKQARFEAAATLKEQAEKEAARRDERLEEFDRSEKNIINAANARYNSEIAAAEAARFLRQELLAAAEASSFFQDRTRELEDFQLKQQDRSRVREGGLAEINVRGLTQEEITPTINLSRFQRETQAIIDTVVDPRAKREAEKARSNAISTARLLKQLTSVDKGVLGEKTFAGLDISKIEEKLGEVSNIDLTGVPEEIKKDFLNQLKVAADAEFGISPSELNNIVGDFTRKLTEFGSLNTSIFGEITTSNQAYLKAYAGYLEEVKTKYQEELEFRDRLFAANQAAFERETRTRELIASTLGQEVPLLDRQRAETLRAIKAQADLRKAGLNVQAGDIGTLSALRKELDAEVRALTEDIAKAREAEDVDKQADLSKEQLIAQTRLQAVNRELERLADQSDRTNDIFGEMERNIELIERERAAREQMLGALEEFVVGGKDVREQLNQAAQGVRQAVNLGTLQFQQPEQRQATVALLDKLSDVELVPGLTGREIKQELVFRDALSLGLDPRIAQTIATATTKEQALIDANLRLAEEVRVLNATMRDATLAFKDSDGNRFSRTPETPEPPRGASQGGLIYRAKGGPTFKPRGTDTVPAMLSPGEFVVQKSAVDRVGVPALQAFNNGGSVQYLQGGGLKKPDDNNAKELENIGYEFHGYTGLNNEYQKWYHPNLKREQIVLDPRSLSSIPETFNKDFVPPRYGSSVGKYFTAPFEEYDIKTLEGGTPPTTPGVGSLDEFLKDPGIRQTGAKLEQKTVDAGIYLVESRNRKESGISELRKQESQRIQDVVMFGSHKQPSFPELESIPITHKDYEYPSIKFPGQKGFKKEDIPETLNRYAFQRGLTDTFDTNRRGETSRRREQGDDLIGRFGANIRGISTLFKEGLRPGDRSVATSRSDLTTHGAGFFGVNTIIEKSNQEADQIAEIFKLIDKASEASARGEQTRIYQRAIDIAQELRSKDITPERAKEIVERFGQFEYSKELSKFKDPKTQKGLSDQEIRARISERIIASQGATEYAKIQARTSDLSVEELRARTKEEKASQKERAIQTDKEFLGFLEKQTAAREVEEKIKESGQEAKIEQIFQRYRNFVAGIGDYKGYETGRKDEYGEPEFKLPQEFRIYKPILEKNYPGICESLKKELESQHIKYSEGYGSLIINRDQGLGTFTVSAEKQAQAKNLDISRQENAVRKLHFDRIQSKADKIQYIINQNEDRIRDIETAKKEDSFFKVLSVANDIAKLYHSSAGGKSVEDLKKETLDLYKELEKLNTLRQQYGIQQAEINIPEFLQPRLETTPKEEYEYPSITLPGKPGFNKEDLPETINALALGTPITPIIGIDEQGESIKSQGKSLVGLTFENLFDGGDKVKETSLKRGRHEKKGKVNVKDIQTQNRLESIQEESTDIKDTLQSEDKNKKIDPNSIPPRKLRKLEKLRSRYEKLLIEVQTDEKQNIAEKKQEKIEPDFQGQLNLLVTKIKEAGMVLPDYQDLIDTGSGIKESVQSVLNNVNDFYNSLGDYVNPKSRKPVIDRNVAIAIAKGEIKPDSNEYKTAIAKVQEDFTKRARRNLENRTIASTKDRTERIQQQNKNELEKPHIWKDDSIPPRTIRAKYGGTEGSNVILIKEDGDYKWPINKLSEESRALGSRLWHIDRRYKQQEPGAGLYHGGIVPDYKAGGGTIFKPRGTDTVPAMLTPGEFVIRKSAVDRVGVDTLQSINSGGTPVYRQAGGPINAANAGFQKVNIASPDRIGSIFESAIYSMGPGEFMKLISDRLGDVPTQDKRALAKAINEKRLSVRNFKSLNSIKAIVSKIYTNSDIFESAGGAGFVLKTPNFDNVDKNGRELFKGKYESIIREIESAQSDNGGNDFKLGADVLSEAGINIREQITILKTQLQAGIDAANTKEFLDTASVGTFTTDTGKVKKTRRQIQAEKEQVNVDRIVAELGLARGGKVPYMDSGGGVDKVPAMLTPGEFVMNTGAVNKYGVNFMKTLNRGEVPRYQQGGMVGPQYLQDGGIGRAVGAAAGMLGIDTSRIQGVFDGFVAGFSGALDNIMNPINSIVKSMNQLVESFGGFTMQHTVNVEGLISLGGLNIEAIKNELSQSIGQMVATEVQKVMKQKGDDFNAA